MRLAPCVALAALFTAVTLLVPTPASAAPARLTGDLAAHDPALVRGGVGQDWYVFSTGDPAIGGGTIQIRTSPDGQNWRFAGTVWDAMPAWVTAAVPGANNLWAPELHRYGDTYYLYYVASVFGTNNSVIALATNTTLDLKDPRYNWVDRGEVLRSSPGSDYNSIDPAIIEDARGIPWMAFGSYLSGIRMVQLQWPSGLTASSGDELLHLADRQESPNAIEAPFISLHDGWYYLFTSWGQCCKGVDSDYRIVVGRSRAVTGPYLDRDGRSLLKGGGTTLLSTSGDRVGPGGQSVSDGVLAYHYYDASAGGAPRLGLQQLSWSNTDGWPELVPEV
ncbi:arabinan endo-1,5-alpha-L-arabinosidase [Pseudonocardia aurantiaca]|uniref:Arabinan endo-1,5-alpha-L-arabinosidase n=1 Tax=Pseudonocardia aurantiaca TaxID=75290 RepID=A0ABW4FHG2_9PSEU